MDKARNDYIENQVMQEAMFLDAVEKDVLGKNLDLQMDIKKLIVQRAVQEELKQAQANFVPTEQNIKDHYEKNKNLYNRDDAVKIAFISVPFGDNKPKAKEVASGILKEALETVKNANSRAFSRLAINHAEKVMAIGKVSVETNETEYLDKTGFEEKFGPNSFETIKGLANIGEFAPLFVTDKAFVIMMKTGTRKALHETVEEAKPKIIKRLAYENRGEHYKKHTENLRKKYDIKVYKEQLAELSVGAEPPPKVAELPEKLNLPPSQNSLNKAAAGTENKTAVENP